jgi:hypothetical protein
MVHRWVLVHYGPLRGMLDKTHQKRLPELGIVMIHFFYQSIKGILFWYTNKCNFTGRSWRDPIDDAHSLLGRIPGDLTCMLANASLSIPLPNKGAFIEIGALVNSRFLGGTGFYLCNIFFIVVKLLSIFQGLVTQVCKKLKFLAASSLTFHSYPLVSWPPNKG